jgi:hypothetical protein
MVPSWLPPTTTSAPTPVVSTAVPPPVVSTWFQADGADGAVGLVARPSVAAQSTAKVRCCKLHTPATPPLAAQCRTPVPRRTDERCKARRAARSNVSCDGAHTAARTSLMAVSPRLLSPGLQQRPAVRLCHASPTSAIGRMAYSGREPYEKARRQAPRFEAPRVGLEPTTLRLTAGCSTN